MSRVLVWFSCGAASAVAAKIAISERDNVIVAYCDTSSEHPDNTRFLKDVEKWIGQEIIILKSEKYADTWDVFKKTRYLAGVAGARCTTELKKKLRYDFQEPYDIHVFGFTSEEVKREQRLAENNFELKLWSPLIEKGLNKADCLAMIKAAGIETPAMYKLGYKNNNCIGCVKGQSGYWNKIRVDFPEVFERMSKVERELNVAINKKYVKGERLRVFLDELPPDAGRYSAEPEIQCMGLCAEVLEEIEDDCEV